MPNKPVPPAPGGQAGEPPCSVTPEEPRADAPSATPAKAAPPEAAAAGEKAVPPFPENPVFSRFRGPFFDPAKVERRRGFLINLMYMAVLIAAGVLVLRYLFAWMLPFVLAFIVASALQRPLHWLVRKTRLSKKIFSVVLVVLVVLLIAGIAFVVVWRAVVAVGTFATDSGNIHTIQSTVLSLTNAIQDGVTRFSNVLSPDATDALLESIQDLSTDLLKFLTGLVGKTAGGVANLTTRLPMLLVSFIIWIIASIFLTIDYRPVLTFLARQVPERHRDIARATRSLCVNTLGRLVRAYALLMLVTFLELSVGLSILRVPYSIVVALLTAFVDILPVMGTGTVLIPWAVVSLLLGDVRLFIGLALLYIVITIVRNILEPRLVSQQIGLNPLVTLFFMYLGLRSVGIVGMILFPVIVMILVQLQESGYIRIWK